MSSKILDDLQQPGSPIGSGATKITYDQVRRKSTTYKTDWDSWLNELTNSLEQEERHLDELKYREGVRNDRYYNGEFFWRFSDESLEVRDLPHTDVDPFFPHNWFAYFTDLSVASAMEASPDIIIDPTRKTDDHNIISARKVRELGDYLERELLTEPFRLETEKMRQLYGGTWWYSYWNCDAHKLFAQRPIFQQQTRSLGQDGFMCDCGEMGSMEMLYPDRFLGAVCPGCLRRDQLHIIQAPIESIDQIIGYDEVSIGFPSVECVSPLQMKGDRRGQYLLGQYLRRKRLVDIDVVAECIPWWEPRASGSKEDVGIRAEEMARRTGSSNSSMTSIGSSTDRKDVVVEQWWFQRSKYAHVMFSTDQEFMGENKTRIPAFVPLGEIFKKGLYALKIGSHWMDHRQEDFRKKWVYIPYIYQVNKSDGGSLKDMCEPQREIIHMRSLLYLYLLARAGGGPTIIKPPLSETDFDGSPNTITRLPAGYTDDVQKLFFQPTFPTADPNLTSYMNQMVGEMQVVSQTVSPTTTGDPSAQEMGGTNTARGMMIMNAKAQGLQGPKLMPLAFGQAQAVLQWIELFRENVTEDVPIPLKGKTGTAEWKMIKSADLEGDYLAYPRAGSWIPRPREERQAALQNAFSIFGPVLMNPDPSLRSLKEEIKEAYGLEYDLDNYDEVIRDAMLRIDKMKELLPQAIQLATQLDSMGMIPPDQETGEPIDPTQIVGQLLSQMAPIDEDFDDPMMYMDYFRTYLRGDNGKEADPAVQAAVRMQWKMYKSMVDAMQNAQADQMQGLQDQQAGQNKEAKQDEVKSKMALEDQRHQNKLQEQGHSQKLAADTSLRDKIAQAALDAALAEGQELPVTGKETIRGFRDVPNQPAF